jgi:hypothetical protein
LDDSEILFSRIIFISDNVAVTLKRSAFYEPEATTQLVELDEINACEGVSKPPSGWIIVPVANVICGCFMKYGSNPSLMGEELAAIREVPGGRTTMSAPTPRARRADSSSVP